METDNLLPLKFNPMSWVISGSHQRPRARKSLFDRKNNAETHLLGYHADKEGKNHRFAAFSFSNDVQRPCNLQLKKKKKIQKLKQVTKNLNSTFVKMKGWGDSA